MITINKVGRRTNWGVTPLIYGYPIVSMQVKKKAFLSTKVILDHFSKKKTTIFMVPRPIFHL